MTPAWAIGLDAHRVEQRQRALRSLAGPMDALIVPQTEWGRPGPVGWRLRWYNPTAVTIRCFFVNEPDAPPRVVHFRGDAPIELAVHDYEGALVGTHTYEAAMEKGARDFGLAWRPEPDEWFFHLRPVYPVHWHVFVVRERPAAPSRLASRQNLSRGGGGAVCAGGG